MELKQVDNIYFIGIGGIGMSAIARYFFVMGKNVAGYDRSSSPITDSLKELGVSIHYEDEVKNIDLHFLNKKETMVVYTPAISSDHQQLTYFRANNYIVLKRSEILGEITKNTFCFGVAGTHGKTTTSAILGHIMQPLKATSFLGGILENYDSNLILGEDLISVVEADEFDRSFLELRPNIACITSMDLDHLDIYDKLGALHESFREFAGKVSDALIVAEDLPIKGLTYGFGNSAAYQALNIKVSEGGYLFDIKTPSTIVKDIKFHSAGRHNLMNALAAFTMADVYGVSFEMIKDQLFSFRGVKRRFSYKIKSEKVVLIDDYAHHPTEIKAVETAIREMYPRKKVLAVFQPHLYTRTRDFGNEFADSLSKFDEVLMLDIYPAREQSIKEITSDWLMQKMTINEKKITSKNKLIENVLKSNADVIVMIGAGDISLLVDRVKLGLEKKYSLLI